MIKIEPYVSDRLDDSVFDFKIIDESMQTGMQFYFPETWTYEQNLELKKQWILDFGTPFYLFSFTGEPQSKTPLRSYKKMLGKKYPILQPSDFIEIEIDFNENKSLFACLIRLNENNIDFCLKTFPHPSNSLIFCSQHTVFQKNTILNLVMNGLYQDKHWTINHEKMIAQLCEEGTFIFQSLADGGDRIFWHIFAHQRDKDLILQNLYSFLASRTN
jgi:hypothetical protein